MNKCGFFTRILTCPLIPQRPTPLTVLPNGIPQHLRELPRWVCWNYWWNGKNKWTKPPYQAGTTYKAASTKPETWSDFETALNAYQSGKFEHDGVGIIPPDGMTGIDIDHCRDEVTGELTPFAETILGNMGTYTEVSPSGTGIRIFLIGNKPKGNCVDRKKGIEIYDSGRYFTVTGHVLHDVPIASRQEELDCLHAKLFPPVSTPVTAPRDDEGIGYCWLPLCLCFFLCAGRNPVVVQADGIDARGVALVCLAVMAHALYQY